jgi:hypothetical protein
VARSAASLTVSRSCSVSFRPNGGEVNRIRKTAFGIGERLEGVVLSVRWDIRLGVSALQRFLLHRGDGECTSCPSPS